MTPTAKSQLRLSDLAARKPTAFDLQPDAGARAALAGDLGISEIRKLTFAGDLTPEGRHDWLLQGHLGATVVQPCVVTLNPVVTRIEEAVLRRYLADMPVIDAAEVEMPVDDTVEPLPQTLDLAQVMAEALALALPPYPRSDGAALAQHDFAAPGVTPLSDETAKPFATLAGLRDQLTGKDD